MALPKLFQRIFWHNNTTPAINEDNLNAMSKAIDDIDNRVIELGDDVIEVVPQIQTYLDQAEDLVEAMELLSQNPPYIGANGNWFVWDTNTSAFVDSGIDASITVQIADVTMELYGTTPYVTNTGTNTDPVFHLHLPAPSGIKNIAKTSTSGLVDTYTITLDDNSTKTFTVSNGKGIVSIDKTETVGYTDTYTITYNDGTTSEFYVHNGKSGSGSNITVTTTDTELFNRDVTITDQYGQSVTQQFNSSGQTRFDSLELDGQITVSSTTADGHTATNTLTLTYFGNYSCQLSLWRALVNISVASELYGQDVTVTKNDVVVDTITMSASGTGTFQTFESGTYTFSFTYRGFTYSHNVNVTNNTTYTCDMSWKATVSITSDADIYGYTVVVKNSSNVTVDTVTLDALDGTATVILFETGTYTFNFTYDNDAYSESITVVSGTTSYSVELSPLKLVSWSSGSDADIAKMVNAYYAGKLTLADIQSVWSIGDVRNMDIPAISASGTYEGVSWEVSESHRAQTVQVEILDFNHDNLLNSVGNISKALITVDLKNCLMDAECANGTKYNNLNTERGGMNASSTNVGGWDQSVRRTWCNTAFYSAIPTSMRQLVKLVLKTTSKGDQSTSTKSSYDRVFLLSEVEVAGTISQAATTSEGSLYDWFETPSNRSKLPRQSQYYNGARWLLRSPVKNNSTHFCVVSDTNLGSTTHGSTGEALAPAWCI